MDSNQCLEDEAKDRKNHVCSRRGRRFSRSISLYFGNRLSIVINARKMKQKIARIASVSVVAGALVDQFLYILAIDYR